MARQALRSAVPRGTSMPYINADVSEIISSIEKEIGGNQLTQSLQFSPTAFTHIKRLVEAGGTIITDTTLIASDINQSLLEGTSTSVRCFIDDPQVMQLAEIRRTTRAEVAIDVGLSIPGPKLVVISSAPAALKRVLIRRQHEPLSDVCVFAAPAGFASVVQLKERLRESDMAFIVVRGKKGGNAATSVILNAILSRVKALIQNPQ